MPELAQPVLVALLVLLVPATARWLWAKTSKKLDEGGNIAKETAEALANAQIATAKTLAQTLEAQFQERDEIATARHKDNVARFDRIEVQTTTTNGKVAEQELRLTKLEAKEEVLLDIMLQRQPDRGA